MGDFLSTPNKEKESEDNESNLVIKNFNSNLRSDMEHAECKVGESVWKIPIFPI